MPIKTSSKTIESTLWKLSQPGKTSQISRTNRLSFCDIYPVADICTCKYEYDNFAPAIA